MGVASPVADVRFGSRWAKRSFADRYCRRVPGHWGPLDPRI